MTRSLRAGGMLAAWALLAVVVDGPFTATAQAQTRRTPPPRPIRPTPHAGSWEVSGGFLWQGGFDLGSANAELIRNPVTGTGPYDLFSSSSKLGAGLGVQARIAGYLSKNLSLEAGVRLTRPVLEVHLTGDVESAADQIADETLTQYVIDGSLVWHFPSHQRGRVVPYVAGGAGYIRDVHDGSALIETGAEYHGTGGFKWWFSSRPRRLGLRGEAGFSLRDGGFDFVDDPRIVPIASASLVYLF